MIDSYWLWTLYLCKNRYAFMAKWICVIYLIGIASTAVAQDKKLAVELLAQGQQSQQEGRYEEALILFNQALAIDPGQLDGYLARAFTKDQLRDYKGALIDYSIYLEKRPEHYDALLGKANVQYKIGNFEEARLLYKKLLNAAPGETNIIMFQQSASASGTRQITSAQSDLSPVIYNYIGLTEYKLKNFPAAIAWFDSAIAKSPREADFYVNRALALEGVDAEKAINDYESALRINPHHTLALHNLAVLSKKGANSTDYIDRAIDSDSTMLSPYLERAFQRMQSAFWKGALQDYDAAIRIEPNDPEIFLNRGYVREKMGDPQGAYADYTKAVTLDENFGKAWLNRGNVLTKLGRFREAVEDYSAAITYDAEYAAAYHNRAVAREKLKQREEACADLKKAEELGMKVDEKLRSSVCK